jgi:spore maturation protein CgeB
VGEKKEAVGMTQMKILFSGHHNPHFFTITEYIERAIRMLEHELLAFEDRQHRVPGRIRKLFPFLNKLDLRIINHRMLSMAEEAKPDIAIITGGHRISADTIHRLKSLGVLCVLWTIDAPSDFQPILDAAPFYDHIFCQGTEAIELLDKAGIKGAQWLPMACDSDYHHPVECTDEDKKKYGSDIVFVGSCYPERAALLEKLVDFDLAIWGPGWDALAYHSPLRLCLRGAHTTPAEWLKIYSASKIVLATHYHDPQHRFPVYQASPRVFEALACGSLLLCDDQRDVFSLFQDGVHLVKFMNITDLIDKVKYYLSHPHARTAIAVQGRRSVAENHTYVHRINKLISHIGGKA